MGPSHKDRRGGFTLIEVLIAFVILGVASLALYRGMTTGLSGTQASEARIAATLLARSKLEEVGAAIPVEPGVKIGTAGDLRWATEILPFLDPGAQAADDGADENAPATTAAYQVTVTVADQRGSLVTLTSWRLAPKL